MSEMPRNTILARRVRYIGNYSIEATTRRGGCQYEIWYSDIRRYSPIETIEIRRRCVANFVILNGGGRIDLATRAETTDGR